MAVLNVTPDSFFDGGRHMAHEGAVDVERTLDFARLCVAQGADVLDIGGESTRPGSAAVSPEEESRRVLAVLAPIAALGVPVSIDTRHAEVAARALAAGAAIVNDVSGLSDPDMADVVAEAGAGLVLGHLRGVPETMQTEIHFDDLLGEVAQELSASAERARRAGVMPEAIVVDPGIGFGKSARQSAALVAAGGWLRARTGFPVLIGASRKSFLGRLGAREDQGPKDRQAASVVAALLACDRGASMVRVHDVGATREALDVWAALAEANAELSRDGDSA